MQLRPALVLMVFSALILAARGSGEAETAAPSASPPETTGAAAPFDATTSVVYFVHTDW